MTGLYRNSQIVRRNCRNCNKYVYVWMTKRYCGLCRTPFESNRSNANERPTDTRSGTQSGCSNSCSICIQLFNTRETNISELVCRHRFHSGCIQEWFRVRNNCPVCRTTQPSVTNQQQIDSEELLLSEFRIDQGPSDGPIFEQRPSGLTLVYDSGIVYYTEDESFR